jgi:hypothetical protein
MNLIENNKLPINKFINVKKERNNLERATGEASLAQHTARKLNARLNLECLRYERQRLPISGGSRQGHARCHLAANSICREARSYESIHSCKNQDEVQICHR